MFFLPSQDSYVSAQQPDTNFGGAPELLTGQTTTNLLHAFIQFDLSTLSRAITITSATLQLFLEADSESDISKPVSVFPVIQPWQENEVNFLNQPASETTPVDTVMIQDQVGTFITWNMLSVVQDWHSGALSNDGIVLRNALGILTFASREAVFTTTRIRPLLTVQFQLADFANEVQTVETTNEFQSAATHNVVGFQEVSFFIQNTGANDAEVQVENSPDGVVFQPEGVPTNVSAGMSVILVPQFFTQFVRVRFRSANPDAPTTLTIWFQAQGC